MAQLITVRLNKSDQQPLGFRLQGGKDFGTPLLVQKVNGGSAAERAGLQAGDALIRVNTTDVYTLRHQEAQDAIRASGPTLELTVQRGGSTWRPAVTPTGSLPRPGSRLGSTPTPVTTTSLKANPQPTRAFGSGHNSVAKPFGYMNGSDSVKSIVNKQYNTPVNMYSDQTIAETLSAQTEVLAGGVLGVNFKKNEKTYDVEKSAVFKVLQEEQNDPEPEVGSGGAMSPAPPVTGLRHVSAPVTRPDQPINNTGGLPPGQNICEECERLITGVFVRIKDKNLHVECFKCSTCGTSLKNQGYYNLNGKLYCDIHAKLVARQNPPAPNLEPVTIPPGGRAPTNAFSTPLPPLATNNYTNGSSSMFSPSSNVSGPKPFGSSLGSAYSPSLSPRSAPLSPARPAAAPSAPAPHFTPAPAPHFTPAPAPHFTPAPAPHFTPSSAAPFAPTNETSKNNFGLRPTFKSPAEERLIRKMVKMALNGYEIGIQRKIKPADHIQSMANKIQDTVVTKHPLNAETFSSDDNNREETLRRPVHFGKTFNIQSMANKIQDTLVTKHPLNADTVTSGDNSRGGTLKRLANFEKIYGIPSMGNTIQDSLVTKHPLNVDTLSSDDKSREGTLRKPVHCEKEFNTTDNLQNLGSKIKNTTPSTIFNGLNGNIPVPPPIPNSPLPSLNNSYSTVANKQDINPNTLSMTDAKSAKCYEKTHDSNEYLNSDDLNNKKENSFPGTLKKAHAIASITEGTNVFEKYRPDVKENFSNALNTTDIFDKKDTSNNLTENGFSAFKIEESQKPSESSETINEFNTLDKTESRKNNDLQVEETKMLTNNLHDNTLYSFKYVNNGGTHTSPTNYLNNNTNEDCKNVNVTTDIQKSMEEVLNFVNKGGTHTSPKNYSDNYNTTENYKNVNVTTDTQNGIEKVAVKLREKKANRNDDGRRDSHIIARPLSTITSLDVTDGQYPVCHKCDKVITRGPFITALGRIWCPEHFICTNATCRRPLQDIGFVEENGQLYCEFCFEQYIAPACDKCHAKIKGDCLNAIGKHFHPECFNCVHCGKLFGNNPFFLEDGLPYCEADWNELFTTKCFACGFPVEAGDRWVEALNNNYHSQCFNCTVCKKNLEGQSFFAKGGRPFCKSHAR